MNNATDILDEKSGIGVVIENRGADTISLDQIGEGTGQNISTSQSSESIPLSRRIKGISLMVLSSLLATVNGAIVKHLNHIPVGEVIFIQAAAALCFFCPAVLFMGEPLTNFPHKGFVFLSICMGTISFIGRIWSLQNLPIGDANALYFTSPLFTGIIARIFIREKLTLVDIGAMIAGLCGVILIAKPDFIFKSHSDTLAWYYFLVPVLAAVFLSSYFVMIRSLGGSVSSYTIAFYSAPGALVGGLLYHVIKGDPYLLPACHLPRLLLIVAGACAVSTAFAMTLALSYEKAATAILIRNLDTALAFVVQVALFGVAAETLSVVGAVLIMLGTICLTLSKIFDINCGITF